MRLIAFVGFQSSGKNTAALALYPYGVRPISFADALKDMLAAIFCWDRRLLDGITEESRLWREQVDPWWAAKLAVPHFTPRWAMRNIGTEVLRQYFHQELWIFNVERRLALLPDDSSVVLIDCRFANEIALARRYGGQVIRIRRGPDPDWMPLALDANISTVVTRRDHARKLLETRDIHPSEYGWIGSQIDLLIDNDGTIADLHAKIEQVWTANATRSCPVRGRL